MLWHEHFVRVLYHVELLLVLCTVNFPLARNIPLGSKEETSWDAEEGRMRSTRDAEDDGKPPWAVNQNVCPPVLPQCQTPPAMTSPADGSANEPIRPGGAPSPFFEGDILLTDAQKPFIARSRLARLEATRQARQKDKTRGKGKGKGKGKRGGRRRTRQRRSVQEESLTQLESPLETEVGTPSVREKRAIVKPISKLWKYGVVPYVMDSSFSRQMRSFIEEAMEHYERKLCIKFKAKTEEHTDYIFFINQPGCWSSVGHIGGMQMVSLGFGCEHLGTAIHETGHALGFWHEQSRPDRDKYLKVLKKNISPSAMDQFDKRSDDEAYSRGFPYDYQSIMHYGPDYYSKNTKDTLQVIGIGKKRGFTVGQRRRLSELDVAQLKDMYYCNNKDARDRACDDGWTKQGDSCYKFVKNLKEQFSGANKYCKDRGGYLVHINDEEEDKFLKSYLINNYASTKYWRTGGKKVDGVFKWYSPTGKSHSKMRFQNWSPNHPGKFSTLALVLYKGSTARFVWRGVGAGTSSWPSKTTYAFICESKPKGKCFKSRTTDGRDYRGHLDYTSSGITCQRWSSLYPHRHSMMTGDENTDVRGNGLGTHNYCRNPGGRRARPWCYTTKEKQTWEYCDVEICK